MILRNCCSVKLQQFFPESFHSLLRVYSQLNPEFLANAFHGTMLRQRIFQTLAFGEKALQQGIETV